MKNVLIIYNSRTGITKNFGYNIGDFLEEHNITATVVSMDDYNDSQITDKDGVLLGCWTHGLMIIFQHPEQEWVKFAKKLPDMKDKKVGLFTTYKLSTGSMFRKMRKPLTGKITDIAMEIKSKNGNLSEQNKKQLESFIQE